MMPNKETTRKKMTAKKTEEEKKMSKKKMTKKSKGSGRNRVIIDVYSRILLG